MAGNGPLNTSPVFASDEMLFIRSRGDYANLSNSSEQLAHGTDGVFASGLPWTLTSASVDFQGQGLAAQNVIQITGPKPYYIGTGRFFAVDSVAPNTVVLRVIGKALNVGQPPSPSGGLSGVTFVCNTFMSLLEDASWDLKSRFAIDEAQAYRASFWMYAGAEDPYRDLRAATVLQTLKKAFQAEVRAKDSDWELKLHRICQEYIEVLDRVQIRWGPFGNSAQPDTIFSTKISR